PFERHHAALLHRDDRGKNHEPGSGSFLSIGVDTVPAIKERTTTHGNRLCHVENDTEIVASDVAARHPCTSVLPIGLLIASSEWAANDRPGLLVYAGVACVVF
ncbi:hypothetical protein QCM80_45060, partial [Bradyrhizobium sp. SSUT112]|uniref:hypothetical protein n=1 Tax=Bradyrhizobium sp. SSUT112 TaxID=3040604 RepID=UPI00244A97E5